MGSCVSSSAAKSRATATNGVAKPRPSGGRETGRKRGAEKRDREGGRRKNPYNWSSGTVANMGGGGGCGDDGGGLGEEALLHRIEERMFLNGASDVACLHTQQGRKGTNQDAMLVWENFPLSDDAIFCGVFDGHGPYGHMVAKKVRDSLPLKLCSQWKSIISAIDNPPQSDTDGENVNSEETVIIDENLIEPGDAHHDAELPEMYLKLRQSLLKSFTLMDKELKVNATVDCFCSGTTAVTLVKQGQDLVIANVGDSRAVLGTRDEDNSLIAVQLTVDLKPNLPREAARIEQCRGRVFALQDEPEVARVWLPNNDSPGLAMARAFGDFCLKDYGLISVPDISYRCLTDKDEFIVLATDGVWDVFSNEEVVDMVASAPTRGMAARALVGAVRAWRVKFPTSKSDDCAVVCLFLNHSAESELDLENSSSEIAKETEEAIALGSMGQREIHPQKVQPSASETNLTNKSSFENAPVGYDEIEQITEIKMEKVPERSPSARSLADCISSADDEEWSALEGVTRVNSLLNLPRFLSGDKKSASWRKWL